MSDHNLSSVAEVDKDLDEDLGNLGLTEDDDEVEEGVEMFMPEIYKKPGSLALKEFRQILTFDAVGKVIPVNEAWLSPTDKIIFASLDQDSFSRLPAGCIYIPGKGFGSAFPVSPVIERAGNRSSYQWWLSGGHISSREAEAVQRGLLSTDRATSGSFITPEAAMEYEIILHGEQDKDRYPISVTVHSPPGSPSAGSPYHRPEEGPLYTSYTDCMLLKLEVDLAKYSPNARADLERNRFLIANGQASRFILPRTPVAVIGTPGAVTTANVAASLGQKVKPEVKAHMAAEVNNNLLAANRRGISFGHIISTNGRLAKHTCSTRKGMSGGAGVSMDHPGTFEFVHIAKDISARDMRYNRGTSKDDPFLVCGLVEFVIPDLAGFNQWQFPGQEASLRTWLSNHEDLLKMAGLWKKVQDAGLAA